ncbi:MAG: mRNA surveillance protein pelota [Candidatus Micrarchaeota archaeon]
MRIHRFAEGREGELRAEAETLEDLWLLSRLIEPGDRFEGTSFRRVKALDLQRADSGEKKLVRLLLEVSQAEIAEAANKLRVTGKILEASPAEYAPLGQFHTVDIELGTRFKLFKEFSIYHRKLLEEAKRRAKQPKALIVVMDDRQALFCELRQNGIKFLYELENEANKREPKRFAEQQKAYFAEILAGLQEKALDSIIIAGPGFTKEEFRKFAEERDPRLVKKAWFGHASSAEKTAVYELLKTGALHKAAEGQKLQEEFTALEALKKSLGRADGMAVYGIQEAREAVSAGAAERLLVSDVLLRSDKSLNPLLEQAERLGAGVLIFNSEDDAGREFSAFQIAALLRYRTKY